MPRPRGASAGERARPWRARSAAVALAATVAAGLTLSAVSPAAQTPASSITAEGPLAGDLDRIFSAPALDRAFLAVRVQSLRDGRVLFDRNASARVIPGSVMKLITSAVAAERLGWGHRFETRLETHGVVDGGILRGDLVVVGTGDPSIVAHGDPGAPLFDEWADALRLAGISRVDGRLIGDDNAFDDEPLGAGWAWDYLAAGYAAPSGALSYNENVVVLRIAPGAAVGGRATVAATPRGHGLTFDSSVTTGTASTPASITIDRAPGTTTVTIRGQVPAGGGPLVRTTTIENPTRFFIEGFRQTLALRGIGVSQGAWDIDDVHDRQTAPVRVIARRESEPLSSLVGYTLKVSQNYYGEMLIKALGRSGASTPGSTERGRQAVRETLAAWKLPLDALVMYDGSGLSRYNYLSAHLLVSILARVWDDERLRGPFVAALPVGGHDGTLETRMRNPELDRRVQAKTGTINNVRSLAGYAETMAGEKLAFAMIANHYTAPNAQIDAAMEAALERVIRE